MNKQLRLIFIDLPNWISKNIFLSIILTSCNFLESEIVNDCDDKIDRIFLDTQNLKIKYYLNSSDTFFIKPAIKHRKDTMYLINKILMINDLDTIIADDYMIFKSIFFNNNDEIPFKIIDSYFKNN